MTENSRPKIPLELKMPFAYATALQNIGVLSSGYL